MNPRWYELLKRHPEVRAELDCMVRVHPVLIPVTESLGFAPVTIPSEQWRPFTPDERMEARTAGWD